MSRRSALICKISVLFIYICVVVTGCNPPVAFTPINDWGLNASTGIQGTLNNYNAALANNDKTLFMSTVDQDNQLLKDSFSANFDFMERTGMPKTVKLGMSLAGMIRIDQELVLVEVRRDRDGWRADWFFREVEGQWVITEPTTAEAGAAQSLTSDNYTFVTYPVADAVNEKMIALMPKAREHVRQDLGQVPTGTVEVQIYPAAALSPLGGALSGWDFSATEGGADQINILTPLSYYYGFYDPQTGWESDFEMLLTHELARIAYKRNFGNPGQGADWLFEGLAEYVAGYDEMPEVIAAVENNSIIPIIDTATPEIKVDLAHFAYLGDTFLAYGLSESLVTYIVEQHGGLETFWNLARAYDESQDMQTAIQEALGVSYDEFDAAWRNWLKEDYIKRGN